MTGDYERAIEDVASWMERQVRLGTLAARIRLADQLRDGTWRAIPVRATADRDVPEARALARLSQRRPLTGADREALETIAGRARAAEAREARAMSRMAAAFGQEWPQ